MFPKKSKIDNNIILKLDLTVEKADINKSFKDYRSNYFWFGRTAQDSTVLRMKCRINHISDRVQRLQIPTDDMEMLAYKNEFYATCLSLELDLHEKILKDCEQLSMNWSLSRHLFKGMITAVLRQDG